MSLNVVNHLKCNIIFKCDFDVITDCKGTKVSSYILALHSVY